MNLVFLVGCTTLVITVQLFVLYRIECLLSKQAERNKNEMTTISDLQREVERNTSVNASALALIQGLGAQLQAAGTDPVKLQEIITQLQTNDDALAAAVVANTPAVK